MSKVFVVIKELDEGIIQIQGVFNSKEKAEQLVNSIEKELNVLPAIPEDIWDEIDFEAYSIIEDDPKYQNKVKWNYANNNEYYKRTNEVEKAIKDLYVEFICKKYPFNSKEECEKLYDKQLEYERLTYDITNYNGCRIEEYELQ